MVYLRKKRALRFPIRIEGKTKMNRGVRVKASIRKEKRIILEGIEVLTRVRKKWTDILDK